MESVEIYKDRFIHLSPLLQDLTNRIASFLAQIKRANLNVKTSRLLFPLYSSVKSTAGFLGSLVDMNPSYCWSGCLQVLCRVKKGTGRKSGSFCPLLAFYTVSGAESHFWAECLSFWSQVLFIRSWNSSVWPLRRSGCVWSKSKNVELSFSLKICKMQKVSKGSFDGLHAGWIDSGFNAEWWACVLTEVDG